MLIDTEKPRKTCAEVAGRRTFRILTSSHQSDIWSKNSNTHKVQQIHTGWQVYTQGTYYNAHKTTKNNTHKTFAVLYFDLWFVSLSICHCRVFYIISNKAEFAKKNKHRLCFLIFNKVSVKHFLFWEEMTRYYEKWVNAFCKILDLLARMPGEFSKSPYKILITLSLTKN